MFQIADVMYRGDHRAVTAYRCGVLHVQHVGTVFADAASQVKAQPQEGVSGYAPDPYVLRNRSASFHAGHVSQDVAILIVNGECVQETSNVNLVACEVSANGMGINGDEH
jgi:hypothetical protein